MRRIEAPLNEEAFAALQRGIYKSLEKDILKTQTVIAACDCLARRLEKGDYLPELIAFGMQEEQARAEMRTAGQMLKRQALEERLKAELGMVLPAGLARLPLGVLFHIAAGNAHGLPVYSVLEGLLCGNINVIKLPGSGDEISIRIMEELIAIEPRLEEYIYLCTAPSSDVKTMKQLEGLADAVVIWGGGGAVSAIRSLAEPNTKVIEWGHKMGFAYVSRGGMDKEGLSALADSIAYEKGLLCSSCQVVYLDTDSLDDLCTLAEKLLPLLDDACERYIGDLPSGLQARLTLQRQVQYLEGKGAREWKGRRCRIIACLDSELETAIPFGNILLKPLKRENILPVLKPYKGFLQTALLLCGEGERRMLCARIAGAGAVFVRKPGIAAAYAPGMPHDGEYPLQRYTRLVWAQ